MKEVQINGTMVPFRSCGHATNGDILLDLVLESRVFDDWSHSIDSRFSISEIILEKVDFKGTPSSANVMFVRLAVTIEGKDHKQIVQLRGGTCVMLPILTCGMCQYTILVSQPRIAVGDFLLEELPAGMIDGGSFSGAAARELKEELGLTFEESELIDITGSDGIYLSPGLLDEKARVYLAQREVTSEELEELKGKVTGVEEEGERMELSVHVVDFFELVERSRDAKSIAAMGLYANYLYKQLEKNSESKE